MENKKRLISISLVIIILGLMGCIFLLPKLNVTGKTFFSSELSAIGIENAVLEVNRDTGEYNLLFIPTKDRIIKYPEERSFIAYWIFVNGNVVDAKTGDNNKVYKIFSGNLGKISNNDEIIVKVYFNTDLNGAQDIVYTGYYNANEGVYNNFPLVLRAIEKSQINYLLYAYNQGIEKGMITPVNYDCGLAWGYCNAVWGQFDMKKIEPYKTNIIVKDEGEKVGDQEILVYRFEDNKCSLAPVKLKNIDSSPDKKSKDHLLLLDCEKHLGQKIVL